MRLSANLFKWFLHQRKAHSYMEQINLEEVKAPINRRRAEQSIGTLGGGNH